MLAKLEIEVQFRPADHRSIRQVLEGGQRRRRKAGTSAGFDDAAWKPAKEIAKLGEGPWGNAFSGAAAARPGAASAQGRHARQAHQASPPLRQRARRLRVPPQRPARRPRHLQSQLDRLQEARPVPHLRRHEPAPRRRQRARASSWATAGMPATLAWAARIATARWRWRWPRWKSSSPTAPGRPSPPTARGKPPPARSSSPTCSWAKPTTPARKCPAGTTRRLRRRQLAAGRRRRKCDVPLVARPRWAGAQDAGTQAPRHHASPSPATSSSTWARTWWAGRG